MSDVCARVREWADKEGVSLSEALERLGVSPSVFYNWEKGGRPQPVRLRRLAEKMGADPSVFVNPPLENRRADKGPSISRRGASDARGAVLVHMPASSWNKLSDMLTHFNARLVGPINGLAYTNDSEFIVLEGVA